MNYLIFDKNFVYKTGGFKRLSATPKETGTDVAHERLAFDGAEQITITEAGYVYIYLSNENPTPVEVYFDDFKVTHSKGPIVSTQEYYPFGLAFNSYQRENSLKQDYQYNGKEQQDELNLAWMDYGARMYDAQIARWSVVDPLAEKSRRWSPYKYAFDNPLRFIDPDGMAEAELKGGYGETISATASVEHYGPTSSDLEKSASGKANSAGPSAKGNGFSDKMASWSKQYEKKNEEIFGTAQQDPQVVLDIEGNISKFDAGAQNIFVEHWGWWSQTV